MHNKKFRFEKKRKSKGVPASNKLIITEEKEFDIENVADVDDLKQKLNRELLELAQESKRLKNRAQEIKEILAQL